MQRSLVMLPSTHSLHEDSRKAGKHQKKYGNVYRSSELSFRLRLIPIAHLFLLLRFLCLVADSNLAAVEDEGRPIHLLQASLPRIRQFVTENLPASASVPRPPSHEIVPAETTTTTGGTNGDVEMASVGSAVHFTGL